MTAPAPPLVQVEGLTRVFDVSRPWLERTLAREGRRQLVAVNRVSFSIGRGETLALVGESGSGKSTVARMTVGLLQPTAGRVSIDGIDMWASRRQAARHRERQRLRRRLQMIFQDPFASLNPRWRVARIVADPIKAFGLAKDRHETEHRVAELLRLVGLDPADGAKYPHEFSGGQRQRICIARALATEPELLIADEAVSALDVSVQAQVLALLEEIRTRLELAMLFITHDLRVAAQICDHIAVMSKGEVVEYGPAQEIFRAPKHEYTQALFSAAPGRGFVFGAA